VRGRRISGRHAYMRAHGWCREAATPSPESCKLKRQGRHATWAFDSSLLIASVEFPSVLSWIILLFTCNNGINPYINLRHEHCS
jgi:hypothetical protein